ncbi:hypothetical protein HF086_007452 [Spodoptera exigua]|uniref:ZAD domain-containing protein n=1 Tax=Spodoptera exigua TaxID=7107 RepID=A0A922MTL9_SPOEX|nr:hypothetical protein HF086_007452 [Spodoptera exigua]
MCNLPPKFHSVCRLCLSFCGDNCSDVKLPIFDRDKDKSRLSEMIMANLSIMVSPEDLLPQVVCGGCAHKLDEFHTFRELSHKSERLLEQFVQYANSLSGPKEKDLTALTRRPNNMPKQAINATASMLYKICFGFRLDKVNPLVLLDSVFKVGQ